MNRSRQWFFVCLFALFLSMPGSLHAAERDSGRDPVRKGALVLWKGVAEALDHLITAFWSDNGGSLDPFGQPKQQGSNNPAPDSPDLGS